MCETFGLDFEKNVYKTILEDLDYKDFKSPINSNKSTKIQFLIQEFPVLLEKENFVDFFSETLNLTKLSAHGTTTASEFFECISKLCKLNIENQLKVLISMNLCQNETLNVDAPKVFVAKCKEIIDG